MLQRIITGLLLVALLFIVALLCPLWLATIFVVILCVWAYLELMSALKRVKSPWFFYCGVAMAIALPVLSALGCGFLGERVALVAFTLILFMLWMMESERGHANFQSIATVFFAGLMIPLFYSSLVRIIYQENGRALLFMPFIAAYVCDTAAYFIGSMFGRHPLAPKISPKKSVEGAAAGVVVTLLAFLIYGLILQSGLNLHVNFGVLMLYGLLGSIAGILGDLSLSLIKRELKIKDFSHVFPGHGGILDRFDSLLFAAPVIEILLMTIPGVQ